MYIKLDPAYVDPDSGAPLPTAILVVQDATFNLHGGSVILQAAVYASPAALAAGHQPVSEKSIALSPSEIAAQQPALLQACLSVLLARSEYTGASLVTP